MPLLKRLLSLTGRDKPEALVALISGLSVEEIFRQYSLDYPVDRRSRLSSHVYAPVVPPKHRIKGIEWSDNAFQAKTVCNVQALVKYALANRLRVRVAGAGHSAPGAIYSGNSQDLRVVLCEDLRKVTFVSSDAASAVVRVGGGCYLGVNPMDPVSTLENSLNKQLDDKGYALPILGGISHQSIAGFLQTSSAGGSLQHGFADAVLAIELVDGYGNVRQLSGDDLNAAAVSMGLMGVVTNVTLGVKARYFVDGRERNVTEATSLLQKQNGEYPLKDALGKTEYMHLNWFPQKFVKRVTQWTGQQSAPSYPVVPYSDELKSKLMNVLAAVVLEITSGITAIDPNGIVAQAIVGAFIQQFVSLTRDVTFHDVWFSVLPSDDQAEVDTLIKVIFTEIWLPLDQLTPALDRLNDRFNHGGAAAGNFVTELYGARKSPFWLSPSYNHDVFRVDIFWWAYSFGDPLKHFSIFWNALLDLPGARLHWGKYLPAVGQQCGGVVFNPAFLAAAYPKLPAWLDFRQKLDPNGVFLSDYWAKIFGL